MICHPLDSSTPYITYIIYIVYMLHVLPCQNYISLEEIKNIYNMYLSISVPTHHCYNCKLVDSDIRHMHAREHLCTIDIKTLILF